MRIAPLFFFLSLLFAQTAGEDYDHRVYHSPEAQRQVEALGARIHDLEVYAQELKEAKLRERMARMEDHEATARWLILIVMSGLSVLLGFLFKYVWEIRQIVRNGTERRQHRP